MIRSVMQALRKAPPTEQRFSLADGSAVEVLLGGRTVAGPVVSPSNALESPTVLACVMALSSDVAKTPLKVYRSLDRGRELASDHPVYRLLHRKPNSEMTPFVFKQTLMGHLLTWGNAYAEIEWGADGYPVALWPLLPDRMTVKRERGALLYEYRPDHVSVVTLQAWQVLHVPGLSFDGVIGYSPVRLMMQTLSGDRATAEFGWKFFANGARPGVILKHPGKLSADAAGRIRQSWNDLYGGVQNAHRAAVLEEGMDIATLGIPPDEAQFLQTRQFTKREIAAIYGVPLQRIGDTETATYASSEQFARDYLVHSLDKWLVNIEEWIANKLFLETEADQYVVEFQRKALIQMLTTEQFQAYSLALQNGWMTPNEIRVIENLNPLPGGDDLLLPLNMAKAADYEEEGESGREGEGESGGEGDGDQRAALVEQAGLAADLTNAWVADVRQRLEARIANDVRQGGAKALRQGGLMQLGEWGEEMITEWRQAGEAMLAPLCSVRPGVEPNVGEWVMSAYQAGIKELRQ